MIDAMPLREEIAGATCDVKRPALRFVISGKTAGRTAASAPVRADVLRELFEEFEIISVGEKREK